MSKQKIILVRITATALLTAVAVVTNRFLSINLPSMSIGLTFVPLMLCGMLFGPLWGGICGALTDFIGATLFPFGPYFPGFTAVAFLSGVLFGLCGTAADKMKGNIRFMLSASVILILKETVCSLLLNTLWITILYGNPFGALFLSRLPLSVVTVVLEIIFALIVKAAVLPPVKRVINKMN